MEGKFNQKMIEIPEDFYNELLRIYEKEEHRKQVYKEWYQKNKDKNLATKSQNNSQIKKRDSFKGLSPEKIIELRHEKHKEYYEKNKDKLRAKAKARYVPRKKKTTPNDTQ